MRRITKKNYITENIIQVLSGKRVSHYRQLIGFCFLNYIVMSKDPAFLFYYQDFFTGISDMTNEEAGAYIRCLCIQASKDGITEKHMKNICNSSDIHDLIKTKFILNNETNLFENTRLKEEISKRKKYSESRANNRKGKVKTEEKENNISLSYDPHMENENENESLIVDVVNNNKKEEKNNLIFKELLISEQWLNLTAMQSTGKFSEDQVKKLLKKYNDKINASLDFKPDKKEYCKHFINWLNLQPKQVGPQKRVIS